MGRVLVWLIAAISFLAFSLQPAMSEPKHAIAMQGDPALPADYTHFDYANPDAPKGGNITYCVVGSFDNLNPFILKSLRTTARGMIDLNYGNLVFEPLMTRNYDEAFSLYGLLADSADMDPERKSIEFHLNPNAKWSDGEPVTPEDVLFTYAGVRPLPHKPESETGGVTRSHVVFDHAHALLAVHDRPRELLSPLDRAHHVEVR